MLLFSLYNTQKNSFAWPKKATRFVGADKIDMHEFYVFQVQHIHYTIPCKTPYLVMGGAREGITSKSLLSKNGILF